MRFYRKFFSIKLCSCVLLFSGLLCACSSSSALFLTGRAFLPLQFQSLLGEQVPVSNTEFQVVDLERSAGDDVVASGTTDAEGRFSAEVEPTSAVAVIVLGQVRVSGLLRADQGGQDKSLDGVTDVACEAGVRAIRDGAITAAELTSERITILEDAAAMVVAQNEIDFTDSDGSRAAAALEVRTLTSDGADPLVIALPDDLMPVN